MLALELQPTTVLGLTAVCTASLLLLLLVTAQAGTELDVNAGRGIETKALRNLDEVELVHIEDSAERVRGVCLEVGTVSILGGLRESVSIVDRVVGKGGGVLRKKKLTLLR